MGSRNLIGAFAALLLVSLLCVCGLGLLYFTSGGDATVLQGSFDTTPSTALSDPPPAMQAAQPQATQAQPEPSLNNAAPTPFVLPSDSLAIVRAEEQVLNQVYSAVSDSVVNISVSDSTGSLVGDLGQGSGFIWDTTGHIVTNNHVVEQAETIIVTFTDNTQLTAEVVGVDLDSDLAVIRVDADPALLKPIAIGSSTDLKVGQRVIAIGNPFGFDNTMTLGIVSAVGRTVPGRDVYSLPNLIQTDAAINPGNSGGPLLDIEGRVVGVNTLIYSDTPRANSGVGFAVPVDKVKAVVPALISDGSYQTPYLGVSMLGTPLTPELSKAMELTSVTYGALVETVVPDGPTDKAGLRGGDRQIELPGFGRIRTGGDVVIAIDERTVREFADIINYLDTRQVGDVVTLTVIRDGEQLEIPVTLGARP